MRYYITRSKWEARPFGPARGPGMAQLRYGPGQGIILHDTPVALLILANLCFYLVPWQHNSKGQTVKRVQLREQSLQSLLKF